MVKASGQIEQELGLLQQKTESMSDALNVLYEGYLQALVEASKRQLVLAAYYLCTQAYPDRFLALSWDQRNQLQRSLQVLAAKIEGRLAEQRDRARKMSRRRQQHNGLEFLQRLLESRASSLDSLEGRDNVDRSRPAADPPSSGDDGSDDVLNNALEATPKRRLSDINSDEGYTHKLGASESSSADSNRDADDGAMGDSSLAGHEDQGDSNALAPNALDDSLVIGEGLFDEVQDSAVVDSGAVDDAARSASRSDDLAKDGLADDDLGADIFVASGLGEDGFEDDGHDARVGGDDDFDFEMEVPAADQRLTLSEEEDLLSALEGLARRSLNQSLGQSIEDDKDEALQPLVPMHLVKQQVLLEKAIRDVFSGISEEANELLQQFDVMPAFPKALMAAAVDARGMGDPVNAVPNVVKMSVRVMQGEALLDSDDEDEDDDRFKRAGRRSSRRRDRRSEREGTDRSRDRSRRSQRSVNSDRNFRRSKEDLPLPHRIMARDAMSIEALPELAAISLRLSEVEFSDPTVSAWRSRLRQKLNDLKQLGMRYKKTQRALETAQAEDAWRSSWTVNQSND
ncbi:MAG: hypothetical protein AAGC93_09700 [Cyanobacteria bacterium P01_F01_bin.53]